MFELNIQMRESGRFLSRYDAYRSFIAQMKEVTKHGVAEAALNACYIMEYQFDQGVEQYLVDHTNQRINSPAHGLPMRVQHVVAHANSLGWMNEAGDWVEVEQKGGSG